MKDELIKLYLEYYNDYLTLTKMSEDKDINFLLLADMVQWGRVYYKEDINS